MKLEQKKFHIMMFTIMQISYSAYICEYSLFFIYKTYSLNHTLS